MKESESDKLRRDKYNAMQFMDPGAPKWRHYAFDHNGKIKSGYEWFDDKNGLSRIVWRGPGLCPEGLRPGEAIINGEIVMVDPAIVQDS